MAIPQGLTVVTIPAPKAYPNGNRLAQLATKTSIIFLFIPSPWVIISPAEDSWSRNYLLSNRVALGKNPNVAHAYPFQDTIPAVRASCPTYLPSVLYYQNVKLIDIP
jgi:hypothetical protein